jgi:hypothetical protein
MGGPKTPDLLPALSLPVKYADKMVAGRSNDLKQHGFNAWRSHISDRHIVTPPTSSVFSTWVNQDTATITDIADGCYLTRAARGSGDSLHCRVRALTGTWDVMVGCIIGYAQKNFLAAGLVLRESSSGKLISWQFGNANSGPLVVWWNSPTSFQQSRYNPSAQGGSSTNIGWFRAKKNGSNIEYYWSPDGSVWELCLSESGLWTSAPDQWGIFINSQNQSTPNLPARADFIDWSGV